MNKDQEPINISNPEDIQLCVYQKGGWGCSNDDETIPTGAVLNSFINERQCILDINTRKQCSSFK